MINKSYKIIALIILIVLLVFSGCSNAIRPDDPPVLPTDEYPAWSPDGKWVAYTHFNPDADDTTYPSGLYMMELETRQRQLLVSGFANTPDWSPDGKKIVFSAAELFILNLTDSKIQQLTQLGKAFFPSWSPCGNKIAFDTPHNDQKGANAIWIINSDGTNAKDISRHGTGEWREPDWSPNGKWILHLRYIEMSQPELFIMDTLGTESKRLTFNELGEFSPTWSPNSSMIAWTTFVNKRNEIWLMKSDGTSQQKLIEGMTPSWSPDSKSLVFSRQTNAGDKIVLWTINIDGTELKQITF